MVKIGLIFKIGNRKDVCTYKRAHLRISIKFFYYLKKNKKFRINFLNNSQNKHLQFVTRKFRASRKIFSSRLNSFTEDGYRTMRRDFRYISDVKSQKSEIVK